MDDGIDVIETVKQIDNRFSLGEIDADPLHSGDRGRFFIRSVRGEYGISRFDESRDNRASEGSIRARDQYPT